MRTLAEEALKCLKRRRIPAEAGKAKLVETRRIAKQGWFAISESLEAQGEHQLAQGLDRFVEAMRPLRTDREQMMELLLERARERERAAGRTR